MPKDDVEKPTSGTAPADPGKSDGGVPQADQGSFLRRLGEFPSLFQDEYVTKASKSRLQAILQTLTENLPLNEEERECDPELGAPDKSRNIPVLLLWMLGKKQEAEERAARAVQENPRQLLALSNLAYIVWHSGKKQEAEQYLNTMESLKETENPSEYDELDYQARAEIAYLYTRISHTFEPFFLSDLHEKLLARRPEDQHVKLRLAMTLQRHTSYYWTATHPGLDYGHLISRAADLYLEIKREKRNCSVLRGVASVRLAEILNKNDGESERLDLTAKDCFKEALVLNGDTAPSVLVKAGRFYREHDLQRSKELLERAVKVRPDARAYYQLGLTLKEIALQRAGFKPWQQSPNPRQRGRGHPRQAFRGGSRHTNRLTETRSEWDGVNTNWHHIGKDVLREERSYKQQSFGHDATRKTARTSPSPKLDTLSVEVQQAIDSFQKAVQLPGGKQMIALLNLGLIYKNLHKHEEALRYFVQVIEEWPSEYIAQKAIEHAGETVQNMVINGFHHEPQTTRDTSEETSEFCFTVNLILQCLDLLKMSAPQARLNPAAWDSLKNVKQVLTQDAYFYQHIKSVGKLEKKLLYSLRSHCKTLPALKLLCGFGFTQARNPDFVWDQIRSLQTRGMLADELLLLVLHYLTLHNSGRLHLNGFEANVCLSVATDRWMKALRQKTDKEDWGYPNSGIEDILIRLNGALARVLFLQGFQLGIIRMRSSQKPVCDLSSVLDTLDLSEPSPLDRDGAGQSEQNSEGALLRNPKQSSSNEASVSVSDCDDDEDETDGLNDLHILFVFDPRDRAVGQEVSAMRTLLDTVCGLKTSCWTDLCEGEGVKVGRTWPETGAADLRVLVVGQKAISPTYQTLIQCWTEGSKEASVSASPRPATGDLTQSPLTKVLFLRPTPPDVQGVACSCWQVPPGVTASGAAPDTTESEVRAARSLLACLLGLQDPLDS